jgi:protein-disulfide isomerase
MNPQRIWRAGTKTHPAASLLAVKLKPVETVFWQWRQWQINQIYCYYLAMRRYLPFAIIALFLLAVVAAGILLYRNASKPLTTTGTEATLVEPGADPPHSYGPATAPVTIEEFGDFQCGACVALHFEMKKIKQEYPDRLRIIYRQSPFEKYHKNAMAAARAAEAAALQGRFWEMHDWLYQHQGEWDGRSDPRPVLVDAARTIGLDIKKFEADLDSDLVSERISLDIKRGESLKVPGTPTVFINGESVALSAGRYEGLRTAIDQILNGAK